MNAQQLGGLIARLATMASHLEILAKTAERAMAANGEYLLVRSESLEGAAKQIHADADRLLTLLPTTEMKVGE